MSDSDLMFRSASELASMVRAGELSARELVQCSLDRIEELNPRLNAFVQVDAERALAAAERGAAGRRTSLRGSADRDQEQPSPSSGLRLTYGCSLMSDFTASYDHNVTRRLKRRRFHRGGVPPRCPSTASCRPARRACSARPATPGTWSAPRAAPPAARLRRSPRGWCQWRTATTAAARSASPLRAVAWWG